MTKTNLQALSFEADQINRAVEVLNDGGLLLYPTDTIWGIGCDATDAEAVAKVYQLKKRDPSKPLVILVDSRKMLKEYVAHVHPRIDTLLAYHQRPLTVIYENAQQLPNNLIAKDKSVAIRLVQDDFCQKMIRQFGKPIVATSANISNEPFPESFGSISSEVIKGIDFVVRHRQCEKSASQPSVLVRILKDGELEFLRT
ncbi:MAG: L-threonylcarbamoyladenylate synthase [Bacteroidota bacterium]